MNLDRVTITGADNSVSTSSLIILSKKYPFVEWGILVTHRHDWTPRYPSLGWITDLQREAVLNSKVSPVKLSLHVCGRWVRQLLLGENEIPERLLTGFQRVQLNFHAERNDCIANAFARKLYNISERDHKQWIFQVDGELGNAHLDSLKAVLPGIDAVPLFDISGGAGILPETWPEPFLLETPVLPEEPGAYTYHGYAGGLGPENLEEQIPKIAAAAGETRIWIDMETRVRSKNDKQFDLEKVERCLQIAQPYIAK